MKTEKQAVGGVGGVGAIVTPKRGLGRPPKAPGTAFVRTVIYLDPEMAAKLKAQITGLKTTKSWMIRSLLAAAWARGE